MKDVDKSKHTKSQHQSQVDTMVSTSSKKKGIRFKEYVEVSIIPRDQPILYLNAPLEDVCSCLSNTVYKLQTTVQKHHQEGKLDTLEQAVFTHAQLVSSQMLGWEPRDLMNRLEGWGTCLEGIISDFERDDGNHPILDTHVAYMEQISKHISVSESKRVEILVLLFKKLKRLEAIDKVTQLAERDLYLEILLICSGIVIPDISDEYKAIYKTMCDKKFIDFKNEMNFTSPCVIWQTDVTGSSLLIASARLSRTVTYEYLLSKLTYVSDLPSTQYTILCLVTAGYLNFQRWKELLQLLPAFKLISSDTFASDLWDLLPTGTLKLEVKLSNDSCSSSILQIQSQKTEFQAIIEFTKAGKKIETFILIEKDSIRKLFRVESKNQGLQLHSPLDSLYNLTHLKSLYDDIMSNSLEYFKNLTILIDTNSKDKPLTQASNFFGNSISSMIGQEKAMKHKIYTKVTQFSSPPAFFSLLSKSVRTTEDYFKSCSDFSHFPLAKFNELRTQDDVQFEKSYIEMVNYLTSKSSSCPKLGDISKYKQFLTAQQPTVSKGSCSAWLSKEANSKNGLDWRLVRFLVSMCAVTHKELIPSSHLCCQPALEGLVDQKVLSAKIKVNGQARVEVMSLGLQTATSIINLQEYKLIEIRKAPGTDTNIKPSGTGNDSAVLQKPGTSSEERGLTQPSQERVTVVSSADQTYKSTASSADKEKPTNTPSKLQEAHKNLDKMPQTLNRQESNEALAFEWSPLSNPEITGWEDDNPSSISQEIKESGPLKNKFRYNEQA